MWSNFWQLSDSNRLTEWKDFRRHISGLKLEQAVHEVNAMWSTAPYVTYYLPPDQPEQWPDPWTLLSENYYCNIAKALGIIYTIYFTSHKDVDMDLVIYYDYQNKERYNTASISQGKYILNYWPYEIVNTKHIEQEQVKMLYQYSKAELQLEKY